MLRAGKPGAVVVTEVFAGLAQTAARARGVDPLPLLALPHPMEGRAPDAIDRIAAAHFADVMALLCDAPGT